MSGARRSVGVVKAGLRAAAAYVGFWLLVIGITVLVYALAAEAHNDADHRDITWEPCMYYDKGTSADGRRVWRSLSSDRLADGSCPEHIECDWADIDWDGQVGIADWTQFTACWQESHDGAPPPSE